MRTNTSIYHKDNFGTGGRTIRLNLRAVKELLGRSLKNFDEIDQEALETLKLRFKIYCHYAPPIIHSGKEANPKTGLAEVPPSINQVPNAHAMRMAVLEKAPPARRKRKKLALR